MGRSTNIAPTVAHIVNLSFEKGIVPADINMAKVIPLYKKGNRLDPSFYIVCCFKNYGKSCASTDL